MSNTIAVTDLRSRYQSLLAENPKTRIREAARLLETSEAALLTLGVPATVTPLNGDFRDLLQQAQTLGEVMALTRNDACVHERHGQYLNVSFEGPVGMALGADIDIRFFMMHWKYGFAVNENERLSFQFFDKSGTAVHKIYMTDKSDLNAYNALVAKFKAPEDSFSLQTEAYPEQSPAVPDTDIDIAGFRKAWLNMKDTHEFFGLLSQFKLKRTQALRLAPEGHAWKLSAEQVKSIFQTSSERQVPIMVFTGNRGCIQIHTGTVTRLVQMGPWYNVLDPMFNLHLSDGSIHEAWVVLKPTTDGIVTGIELYDAKGENIAMLFGKRKPGIPELESWRDVVAHCAAMPV